MGKKLAFKGHPTRDKEVIELLKMLGGKSTIPIGAILDKSVYTINDGDIFEIPHYNIKFYDFVIFTLEEFLEKYPFKVGDKVQVLKSGTVFTIGNMLWDDEICDIYYYNTDDIEYYNVEELKLYKETDNIKSVTNKSERKHEDEIFDSIIWHLRNSVNNGKHNLAAGECEDYFREVVKKNNENKMKNVLAELFEHIKTTSKEDLEREFEEIKNWSNVGPTVEEFRAFCERVNKKPKYPETYKECCDILNLTWNKCFVMFDIDHNGLTDEENNLYESLIKLKRCRDAYWKIASEEMGSDKPWEPNWNDLNRKYFISLTCDGISLYDDFKNPQVLAFPTEEMRDAFYENFKDLIEQCKELL